MGTGSAESAVVSNRYAAALLDMAEQAGTAAAVEKDLADLAAMIAASADLENMLKSPVAGRGAQKKAVLALAEKAGFQDLTRNFLGVLADNRRLAALSPVLAAFRAEAGRRRGEIAVKVEAAAALAPAQTKALSDQLAKALGANVTLDVSVNKDLLGGMIVTVGSRMIDDSVKRKLERLQRAMNSDGYQQKEVG